MSVGMARRSATGATFHRCRRRSCRCRPISIPASCTTRLHPTAAKFQERLRERGLDVDVHVLPKSTRTAPEAAAAVGCEAGQIVKSLVFMRDDEPMMVLCAGDRRVASDQLGLR